jgi:hypothetical protein
MAAQPFPPTARAPTPVSMLLLLVFFFFSDDLGNPWSIVPCVFELLYSTRIMDVGGELERKKRQVWGGVLCVLSSVVVPIEFNQPLPAGFGITSFCLFFFSLLLFSYFVLRFALFSWLLWVGFDFFLVIFSL